MNRVHRMAAGKTQSIDLDLPPPSSISLPALTHPKPQTPLLTPSPLSPHHMTPPSRLLLFCTLMLLLTRSATAFLSRAPSSSLRRSFSSSSSAALAATAKKVLVPIADGSEEIESVTIIDVLVRVC